MKHRTEFSEEELKAAFLSNSKKAEETINDPKKFSAFIAKVKKWIEKGKKIPVLGSVIDSIMLMVELLDDYRTGDYKKIPMKSLIAIVCGLLYLILPVDLIPDIVPGIGFLDDAGVIMIVLGLVSSDLETYRKWRESQVEESRKSLRNGIVREIINSIGTAVLAGAFWTERNTISILIVDDEAPSDDLPINCNAIELNIPFDLLKECNIAEEDELIYFYKEVFDDGAFKWSKIGKIPFQIETDYKEYDDNFLVI